MTLLSLGKYNRINVICLVQKFNKNTVLQMEIIKNILFYYKLHNFSKLTVYASPFYSNLSRNCGFLRKLAIKKLSRCIFKLTSNMAYNNFRYYDYQGVKFHENLFTPLGVVKIQTNTLTCHFWNTYKNFEIPLHFGVIIVFRKETTN